MACLHDPCQQRQLIKGLKRHYLAVIARPLGWVRCVDCECGRTTQVFSDCAITKYLSRATARRPCGPQTIAAVESLHGRLLLLGGQYSQKPCWITLDFKEHRPPTRRRSPRRSPCRSASIRTLYVTADLLGLVSCWHCWSWAASFTYLLFSIVHFALGVSYVFCLLYHFIYKYRWKTRYVD